MIECLLGIEKVILIPVGVVDLRLERESEVSTTRMIIIVRRHNKKVAPRGLNDSALESEPSQYLLQASDDLKAGRIHTTHC